MVVLLIPVLIMVLVFVVNSNKTPRQHSMKIIMRNGEERIRMLINRDLTVVITTQMSIVTQILKTLITINKVISFVYP